MELKNYNVYFFFVILLGVSSIAYFIFKPFFLAIMLAAILAIMLQRPYRFFIKITLGRRSLSSLLTSLLGMITLIVILGAVIQIVAGEATTLYQNTIAEGNVYHRYADPVINLVNQNPALRSLGLENVIDRDIIGKAVSQIGQSTFLIVQKTYQGIASTVFFIFVVFFTLYYFLIEGRKLVDQIMYLSPLKNTHEKILVEKFISITRATAKGAMIIALVQGVIGLLMFSLLGFSSAFILGIAMMFCSLIPMVGAGLIWLPAALVMFISGNVWQGIVILAVGGGIISTIDNFLRPKLVGNDTQMHPLIVFFATLGGLSMFGFLGFIVGPMILALFLALWDIYAEEFKGQLKKYNK